VGLSPSALAFGVIFGSLALALVQIGRKRGEFVKIGCGAALMGLTFVAGGEWWAWLAAIGLLVAGFVSRA
jgi:predicted metal-binding membrane protein